ncbi:MoaD/ThiS family protein [Candidatus Bathyarchaeota archaeon]|nr:MoaD/ThiS family protein [Candidatus Bathyarchaeota archaeon]
MVVKIRMLGLFKKVAGREEILLNLSGELRLREVIERILEEVDGLRDFLLDPELKDPRPNTIVLVNGKEISLLGGPEAVIKDGDEIVLIPVIHGGLRIP